MIKQRFLDDEKELEQLETSSMIPGLHAFDLEHEIISKYNRYRFEFFDRYTFLNLKFDR